MNKRLLIVVILMAALTLILNGCAPAPTSAPETATVAAPTDVPPATDLPAATSVPEATEAPPAAEPTQAPEADEPAAVALDGQALVETRCIGCHSLGQATGSKKTAEEWQRTVERMVGKGAQLNAEEQLAVIQYLAETFK